MRHICDPDPARLAVARLYLGRRVPGGCCVHVLSPGGVDLLWPRQHAASPAVSWGRGGAASRTLAWWLLYDTTGHERIADDWCGDLCDEVVARLPLQAFALASADLMTWLEVSLPASGAPE